MEKRLSCWHTVYGAVWMGGGVVVNPFGDRKHGVLRVDVTLVQAAALVPGFAHGPAREMRLEWSIGRFCWAWRCEMVDVQDGYNQAVAVTPADTVPITFSSSGRPYQRRIWVGTAGTVTVITLCGDMVQYVGSMATYIKMYAT